MLHFSLKKNKSKRDWKKWERQGELIAKKKNVALLTEGDKDSRFICMFIGCLGGDVCIEKINGFYRIMWYTSVLYIIIV